MADFPIHQNTSTMSNTKAFFFLVVLLSGVLISCEFTKKTVNNVNLFTIDDDIRLGKQVSEEIANDSKQFPILSERQNPEVYRYVRGITNRILNSGKIVNRNNFAWEVKIIDDLETLNAFATPGGYIYVYTGLINYLDSEDQLAGVMGHEIAHSDQRHSTKQMTKSGAIDLLLSAALGEREAVRQVVGGIIGLRFSRTHETEADEYSVRYLCGTDYNAAGAAGFFKKIGGAGSPPEFLSTHPNPDNRVQEIENRAKAMACRGRKTNDAAYQKIKNLLK